MQSRQKHTFALSLCLLFTILSSQLHASEAVALNAFKIKNQNPFIQIFGLPATESARISDSGQTRSALSLDIANNSILNKSSANETITLDGESYRLNMALSYGLDQTTELGIEIPLIGHSRGILDNFIEGWHDTFGLTNSERNGATSNSLQYHYQQNGVTIVNINRPREGLGDIRLTAAKRLSHHSDSTLTLHTGLKLPSGDSERLLGSGATDFSVSLAYAKHRALGPWAMSGFVNGGLLFLGDSDVLSPIQNNSVAFGSIGLIWDSGYKLDLKAQLDAHSAFYNSALDQLGSNTLQLTVGGSLHLSPTTMLDIGVGENLMTDTTPDFLINLVLRNN